ERYPKVWLLDLPALAEKLNRDGLTLYLGCEKDKAAKIKVQAASDLSQVPAPDVLIVAVKTYSLDKVCTMLKEKFGDAPLVLALQNGVDNQTILPKYFSKVIYGVVSYNGWIDEPGVVGYQKKGPLVLGTPNGGLADEARALANLLSRGV